MSASKYLPPFTPEERRAVTGDRRIRGDRAHVAPAVPAAEAVEPEVTYADFLGGEAIAD